MDPFEKLDKPIGAYWPTVATTEKSEQVDTTLSTMRESLMTYSKNIDDMAFYFSSEESCQRIINIQ